MMHDDISSSDVDSLSDFELAHTFCGKTTVSSFLTQACEICEVSRSRKTRSLRNPLA